MTKSMPLVAYLVFNKLTREYLGPCVVDNETEQKREVYEDGQLLTNWPRSKIGINHPWGYYQRVT